MTLSLVMVLLGSSTYASTPTEEITIHTSSGQKHRYTVEIAHTETLREKGLMFRKTLDKSEGMLFLFENEQQVTIWMKNTYIPLDILFINKQGAIHHIVTHTEPLSTKRLPSMYPSIGVLEIAAGQTEKQAIQKGDIVLGFPAILNTYIAANER